ARGVLDTVLRLGFLQLDPIATVAPAQQLVLWSRLGAYDIGEPDRLLWQGRKLFEWDAHGYPIRSVPPVRGRMRDERPSTRSPNERWRKRFLAENPGFRRYILRELDRRGPLLGRELEDRTSQGKLGQRWWGNRQVGLMLGTLHRRGEITVVGRR